ncbi:MAG: LytTR family DNA-binding domain-containing protein [Opitutaceae bacterium]
MKIRTLVVDDEPLARAKVCRMLATQADVDVVGEASSGDQAIAAIGEQRPDLLFLDVQMPAPDGIAVMRAVQETWLPCTIFTTAYAQHAVEAFELQAIDYLLKPFSESRFTLALDRARSRLAQAPAGRDERLAALLRRPEVIARPVERFLVKNNERYVVVSAADIVWVESAANYVVLHTPAGNQVLRRTLAQLESELDPEVFYRTSRSTLVNLGSVREVQVLPSGDHAVCLSDGKQVPLTRGLREFQERLQSPRTNRRVAMST